MTLTKKDVTNKCGCPNQDVESLVLRVTKFAKTIGLEHKFDKIDIVRQIVLQKNSSTKYEHFLNNNEVMACLALCTESGYLYQVEVKFTFDGYNAFERRLRDGVVQKFFNNTRHRIAAHQIGENATETPIDERNPQVVTAKVAQTKPGVAPDNHNVAPSTRLPPLDVIMTAKVIQAIHEGATTEKLVTPAKAVLETLEINDATPYLKTKVTEKIKDLCNDGYLVQSGKFQSLGKPVRYLATNKGAKFVQKHLQYELKDISEDLSNLSVDEICQQIERLRRDTVSIIAKHKQALSLAESEYMKLRSQEEAIEEELAKIRRDLKIRTEEQDQIKSNLGLDLKRNDAELQKYFKALTK